MGMAIRELTRVTEFDSQLESMSGTLQEVDSLLNDFNRELSSYVEDLCFDEETFFETEKRLDLINNLKAKYGQSRNWKILTGMKNVSRKQDKI